MFHVQINSNKSLIKNVQNVYQYDRHKINDKYYQDVHEDNKDCWVTYLWLLYEKYGYL